MTIEAIENEMLSQEARDRLDKDARRWKRMGAGAHLDDWLDYGPGFQDMRRVSMSLAHTNRPEGKGYNKAFMEVREYHSMGTMDKVAITHVLWLTDEHYPERLEELKKIRDVMTEGQRSRLGSPLAARQRVEKALYPKGNGEDKPERKSSKETIQDLHGELALKDIEIKRLKEKIEFEVAALHSSVKDITNLNDALNAWKPIREALKQQSITLKEFDEFWELVEYDKTELISLFSQDGSKIDAETSDKKVVVNVRLSVGEQENFSAYTEKTKRTKADVIRGAIRSLTSRTDPFEIPKYTHGEKTFVTNFRITSAEKNILSAFAEKANCTISDVLRERIGALGNE